MAQIKLSKGLYANYIALSTKDADTVYFCSDSGHLYLGSTLLVGGSVTSVTHNAGTEVITIVTQTGTGASSTTVDLGVYLKENAAITASDPIIWTVKSTPPNTLSQVFVLNPVKLVGEKFPLIYKDKWKWHTHNRNTIKNSKWSQLGYICRNYWFTLWW